MKKQNLLMPMVTILFVTLALLVSPVQGSWGGFSTDAHVRALQSHSPIRINNDTEFIQMAQNEGWPGDGSAANPYIIENYDIDATGHGSAIYIGNTTVHFEIRNGVFYNAQYINATSYRVGAGIMLVNVENCTIENITTYNNAMQGILIEHSQNLSINGNTIRDNRGGGMMLFSSRATIANNKIYNNTIGITASMSNNTVIDGNSMYGQSISIEISGSSHITIHNNTLDGAGHGNYGLLISNSSVNSVTNNTVEGNMYGIYLTQSTYNYLLGNVILRSSDYGIYVDNQSSSNRIYENQLFYNHGSSSKFNSSHVQAFDNGTGNLWYDTSRHMGNYWYDWAENNNTNDNDGDGIVDWPYSIDGLAHSSDLYPLKESSYIIPEMHPEIAIFLLLLSAIYLTRKIRE